MRRNYGDISHLPAVHYVVYQAQPVSPAAT